MNTMSPADYTQCDRCGGRDIKVTCDGNRMCFGYVEDCAGNHYCDGCKP